VCDFSDDPRAVGGEASGIDGTVNVVATTFNGRVSLTITPSDDTIKHTASFDLAGADLDELVGSVTAEVGQVFAGEGSEYGYLRLTDERGVWFEGGRSPTIDGTDNGGHAIDAPFSLGPVAAGGGCRLGGDDGYDVEFRDVLASLDDTSEAVPVSGEGTNGTWRGVDVRVVGIRATRGTFTEPDGTADGLGPGDHELVEVTGYLYRRAP
jgi:hypothetical protein